MRTTKLFNFSFQDDTNAIHISATAFQHSDNSVTYTLSHLSTLRNRPWRVIPCIDADSALSRAREILDVERQVLLSYLS